MKSIPTFLAMREKMRTFATELGIDASLRIPTGFRNNVAWNLGHVAVTQQVLCYKLSGLALHVDDATLARFVKGSAPAQWDRPPTLDELLALLSLGERFAMDHEAGLFREYRPYTTSTGVTLANIDEAFAYNLMHEGLHLGYATALARVAG